jgi:hypothetical protein
MTANNDPLGVEFCLSVSRGRTRREGLLMSQYARLACTIRPRRDCRSYHHGMSRADSGVSAESRLPWQTSHRKRRSNARVAKSKPPFHTRINLCTAQTKLLDISCVWLRNSRSRSGSLIARVVRRIEGQEPKSASGQARSRRGLGAMINSRQCSGDTPH